MIRVTVEVLPGGSELRREKVATIDVELVDLHDGGRTADYRVRALGSEGGGGGAFGTSPLISGFERRRGALALAHEALEALGVERT